ncbi:MAG: thiamine/thiamine pyrophosphate ABC transporter permease ThiP [Rhodospirillaceae bacterium]|nr:thiamine/thiamine pyrophosphate ABC transporter permease ThiP [Rhodospirillaceae bacterium]
MIWGWLAAAVVLGSIAASVVGLWLGAGIQPDSFVGDYTLGILGFTLLEAGLSMLLSVGLAIPAARALARRTRFPGRGALIALLALPMVVPPLVGVLAIVQIWGRTGLVSQAARALGLETTINVYGLTGILLAHVFFNMPFATRMLLQAWASIPGEHWRLARQLGLSGPGVFRFVEWPVLRRALPSAAALVFLLCFTSFAIVLALGGGPPNATLEVAIFQAVRFDLDFGLALALAAIQVTVCAAVLIGLGRLQRTAPLGLGVDPPAVRPDLEGVWGRIGDGAAISLVAAVLLVPLAAIAVDGLMGPLATALARPALWWAAARSLALAVGSATLAVALGLAIVSTLRELRIRRGKPRLAGGMEAASSLVLVVPPFVLAAGWFLLLRPVLDVFAYGLGLVLVANVLISLPFVVRVVAPAATMTFERTWRLADSLGMRGWRRLRLIDLPALRRPVGLAFGIAAALAFGDLGVIAMFGTNETETLPLYLYQLIGAYRMGEAAVVGLLLVVCCLGLFGLGERVMGRVPG